MSSTMNGKTVTRAPHRLDQTVMPVGDQRLAQAPDVDIDGTLLDIHIVAPYFVQQLPLAVNPFRGS